MLLHISGSTYIWYDMLHFGHVDTCLWYKMLHSCHIATYHWLDMLGTGHFTTYNLQCGHVPTSFLCYSKLWWFASYVWQDMQTLVMLLSFLGMTSYSLVILSHIFSLAFYPLVRSWSYIYLAWHARILSCSFGMKYYIFC